MMKYVFAACLILLMLPHAAWAQRVSQLPGMAPEQSASETDGGIVAVVNDNVISTFDITARIKLALLSSGLPDNPETRQKLLPQILRNLVDEQLQLQEAKRLDINVTSDEIDKAMERIASDNKIPGDMKSFVAQRGASPEVLAQQIKAGIAWGKVVSRTLRPRVDVGDDEVDAVIERMRANAGKEEYLVSEIVLAVDSPKDEEQVKTFAENIVQQLKSGASFNAVARQFSQGSGAATGGDIGWIQEGQLPQELNTALTAMQPNQIAGPVRSSRGYHILGLREKRTIMMGGEAKDIKLNVQQAFRPFDDATNQDTVLDEAARLRSSVTTCTNLQATLTEKFPGWKWNNVGDMAVDKAPEPIAQKVRDLSIGQASEAIATDKGALVLFVCDRKVPEGNINREAIVAAIGTEKLELQARRLLRDLRRAAYLDLRMKNSPS